jgi:hypothetical protein
MSMAALSPNMRSDPFGFWMPTDDVPASATVFIGASSVAISLKVVESLVLISRMIFRTEDPIFLLNKH